MLLTNTIGHNEQSNIRHAFDEKSAGIMQSPNPLNLLFEIYWYSKSGYWKFIEPS